MAYDLDSENVQRSGSYRANFDVTLRESKSKQGKGVRKKLDIFLLLVTIFTCLFGILMIASATNSYGNGLKYVFVQTVALCLGLFSIYVIIFLDYSYIASLKIPILIFCLGLLVSVLIPGIGTGFEEKGGRSWIRFGSFGFQPAEIAKIGFIITFSCHLARIEENVNKFSNILGILLHGGLFIGLILLEPDAGTAMVFSFMFAVMVYFSGISKKYIFAALGALAAFIPFSWFFILKDYQKFRIINFLNPENDPLASGYQVVQSKIAAGSGQILGKGLFRGTATQLGFLPEKHTDFIFSVISEELGLFGALICVILLSTIILRCVSISHHANSKLGKYIAIGVAAMLTFQMFENIGMCIGLMPVTGITLPFISYGGSSLLTNLIAIGLVLSVRYEAGAN
jgi:rod shape determining protein RodA